MSLYQRAYKSPYRYEPNNNKNIIRKKSKVKKVISPRKNSNKKIFLSKNENIKIIENKNNLVYNYNLENSLF